MNWLQMPCPWGARGAGRGLGSVGPTDTAGPGGHCPSDPEPRAGENLQRKDLCDCSELRGQQGGRAGACVRVCVGGAVRAEPHPPEGLRPGERPPRGCFPPRRGGEAGSGAATAPETSGSWSLRDRGWVHHPLPGTTVCRAAPECQRAPSLWPLLRVEVPGWDQVYTRGLSPNGTPTSQRTAQGQGRGGCSAGWPPDPWAPHGQGLSLQVEDLPVRRRSH